MIGVIQPLPIINFVCRTCPAPQIGGIVRFSKVRAEQGTKLERELEAAEKFADDAVSLH
ncbi:MAG: hypothetical protein V2J55_04655 [Candidatus Competibacteraceae bacterium]|jgi:hypothetical protein|nr:hypothetical protein [Candidatus Competibacteraceae bacterium]